MDDGGPAYPVECSWENGIPIQGIQTGNTTGFVTGLTIRDAFAMAALGHIPALLDANDANKTVEVISRWAYGVADAMLAQRAAPGPQPAGEEGA